MAYNNDKSVGGKTARFDKIKEVSLQSRKSKTITIIAIIVAAALFLAAALYFGTLARKSKLYAAEIELSAQQFAVDETLILAIISVESDFRESAVSGKGAIGLMQILPSTGAFIEELLEKPFGSLNLFSPRDNLAAGAAYLRYLLDKFGAPDVALAAYNGGEGNVTRWLADKNCSSDGKTLSRIPFPETRRYVRKVRSAYFRFSVAESFSRLLGASAVRPK